MVDQVLKGVALLIVELCVLLLDVIADVVMNVAKRLGHWDVHFFYPAHAGLKFFKVLGVVF